MPLARIVSTARPLGAIVGYVLVLCPMLGTIGCDTKGFLDPTETLRTSKNTLVMPIVSQVDPGVEELDNSFANAAPPTEDDMRRPEGNYRISPNDLLAITLYEINGPNTESIRQARVSEAGDVSLPLLTNPIHAAGLTEIELEQAIVAAYRGENIIQHAQVSVTVIEARGRAFSVLGAVTGPGEYAIIESDFRVLNALTLAKNVSSPFVDYVYIIRRVGEEPPSTRPATTTQPGPGPATAPTTGPSSDELAPKVEASTPTDRVAGTVAPTRVLHLAEEPTTQPATAPARPAAFDGFHDPGPANNVRVIRISYEALKRGLLQYNIPIHPHDVIFVPDPLVGFYYMGGHVARPGAFTFNGQKITLKQAVVSASMFDGLAVPSRTDIIRRIRPDHEIFVRVDLSKIFAGEQPDIYLKPDDEVLVGTNALAPFMAAARGAFRLTYGFGFLYDRNYAYSTINGAGGL